MTMLLDAFKLSGGGMISLVGAGGKTSLMNALAEEFHRRGETVLITTTTKIKKPAPEQCPVLILEKDPAALIESCRTALQKHVKLTAAADCPDPHKKLIGLPPGVVDAVWRSGLFKWIVVEADGAARKPLKAPADHEPVIPMNSKWVIGILGLSAIGKPFTDQWVFRKHIFGRLSGLSSGEPITPAAAALAFSHPSGVMKGAPPASHKMGFLNQADNPERVAAGQRIATALFYGELAFERLVIGRLQPETQIAATIGLNK